ncbi:unnamed protein product [Brassica oleracea]
MKALERHCGAKGRSIFRGMYLSSTWSLNLSSLRIFFYLPIPKYSYLDL